MSGSSSKRWASSRARVVFPAPVGPKHRASPLLAAIVHLVFSSARLCVGEIYRYLGFGEVEYGSSTRRKCLRYGIFICFSVNLAQLPLSGCQLGASYQQRCITR